VNNQTCEVLNPGAGKNFKCSEWVSPIKTEKELFHSKQQNWNSFVSFLNGLGKHQKEMQ
jgi:hypothetical protein